MSAALSVVIASNRGGGLARTVASVRESERQAAAPVEVIVAWQGDGEPPPLPTGTLVVPVLPLGLSAARNAGLSRAGAGLVAFVDDDEVVEPGWVAGILEVFADARVDAAFGQVLPADTDGEPYCVLRIDAPVLMRSRRRAPWDIGTGGNMAFRRVVLTALGGFDVRLGAGTPARSGEDADAIHRLQAAGAVLARRPGIVALHPTKPAAEVRASRRPYGRGMGILARRRRSPVLVWNFFSAAAWALYGAVRTRDPARAGELADTVRGWAAGLLAADAWDAPASVTGRAPPEVAEALGGRALTGLPIARRGDVHLVYAAEDLMLHVRTGDPEPLARAVAVQRALAGRPGVPAVRAAARDDVAQWVVEERLELRPLPRDPARWLASACRWFAALPAAGRVRDGEWFARARRALPAVADTLERLADLPAGPAHGDPRPDNLLRHGTDGIALLGWEAAEPDAPRGFDIVALSSRIDGGIEELLGGRGPAAAVLAGLGVEGPAVAWLVTATLAHLAAREAGPALGAPPPAPVHGPLLDRLGPRLSALA